MLVFVSWLAAGPGPLFLPLLLCHPGLKGCFLLQEECVTLAFQRVGVGDGCPYGDRFLEHRPLGAVLWSRHSCSVVSSNRTDGPFGFT